MKKTIATFILSIMSVFCIQAQTSTPRITVRAEVQQNRILLRWAATDYATWKNLNESGITLIRKTLTSDGKLVQDADSVILATGLKPSKSNTLINMADTSSSAAIIYQSLFGDDFEVTGGVSSIQSALESENADNQRFIFSLYNADMNFEAAKEVGWGWEDADIERGKGYLYRIVPNSKGVGSASIFVVSDELTKIVKPFKLTADFSDASALLSWDYDALSSLYPFYMIERSEDGVNYAPVTEIPLSKADENSSRIYYTDSLTNGKQYSFRIYGLTVFGTKSPYSNVVSGVPMPSLTAFPRITDYRSDGNSGVHIDWSFESAQENLISGFKIIAGQDDRKYSEISGLIEPRQRTVHIQNTFGNLYYKVRAITVSGQQCESFPVLIQVADSIPPLPPKGLQVEIDSIGVAHLSWEMNSEPDMLGYKIYRGQAEGEEILPITDTPVVGTKYVDSLSINNLNSSVYYAVSAIDRRYNQSDLSGLVKAEKPETVPPAAPLIDRIDAEDGRNVIHWYTGSNDKIKSILIFRREAGTEQWLAIKEMKDVSSNSYADESISQGVTYEYAIQAKTTKLVSPFSQSFMVISQKGIQQNIDDFVKFTLEYTDKGIKIVWSIKDLKVNAIKIYKHDNEGKLTIFREGLPMMGEFVDNYIKQGENSYMMVINLANKKPVSIKKSLSL